MNADTLRAAVAEAQRFIERAKVAIAEQPTCVGTKAGGAVRRASLDLTRALAEMRRPSWS